MLDLYGYRLSREELERRVGSPIQAGGITHFTYEGGRSSSVRGIRLDTGRLCVEIVADRALDIARATLDGIPFIWRTANDIAAPAFYDPNGDEWLRSFSGGWLTTCGLANFGPAGNDNWGSYGLHGRINNIPAEELAAQTHWDGNRSIFEVRGTLRESKAFSAALVLHRRWWIELGSATLHLEDRVVNVGRSRAPPMTLYHWNAGFPLVGASTSVHVSHTSVQPRDEQSRAGLASGTKAANRSSDSPNRSSFMRRRLAPTEEPRAAIIDPTAADGRGLGFEIAYDPRSLPALFTW